MTTIERSESLWDQKIPLITAISIFTYLLVYVYQWSFAYFFNYPADFILIDVSSLLKTLSFTGLSSVPIFIAIATSFRVYKLSRYWLSFVLTTVVAAVLYFAFVGFVNPIGFYTSGGKPVVFAICFIAFYPMLLTWQLLMDGHKSFRSFSGSNVVLISLFTMLCTSSVAQISAWVSSGKYIVREIPGYYVVNNVGEKVLVGKCDTQEVAFKLLDADKDLTFIKSSTDERNAFRSCLLSRKDRTK